MTTPRRDTDREVQAFVNELNRGQLDSVHRYIATEFFDYVPAADEPNAADVFYELISGLKTAMPDLRVAVQDLRAEGELLVGNLELSGTKDGPLWGSPPSGRTIHWNADIAIRPRERGFALSFEGLTLPVFIGVMRDLGLVNPPDQMDQPPPYPVSPPDSLLKLAFNGQAADKPCSHLDGIRVTEPTTDVCEKCVAQGDIWPALRMCLTCGHVGCCDTSKNKHAKQHYEETGHPLMRSIRLDEGWIWCYPDNAFFSKRTLETYR